MARFSDPTLDANLRVWGEIAVLQRLSPVPLLGLFTAPDSLRRFGGVTVDTVDAALTVRTADIEPLAIQAGEQLQVRDSAFHVIAILEDDGAGSSILLRRLIA